MAHIDYKENFVNEAALLHYFEEVAEVFTPNLLEQVDNISDYVRKIKKFAHTFEAWNQEQLIGILAVYLNDSEREQAFITSVSVRPNFQKKGIANKLFQLAIASIEQNSFSRVALEVHYSNQTAMKFYLDKGFCVTGSISSKNTFLMQLELKVSQI